MDEELREDDALENAENPSEDDKKSAISSDLIRGHINTIILRTLYERDKYGYEIIEEIETKSHGQYTLKQPTLYSALKRLESQGFINAYWKNDEVSQGGRRKYYTLTDSGREITEKNQAEWEYSRTVIDNLISDRNFDFTQPAPASVDFKILKNSTTRATAKKTDDSDEDENDEGAREVKYDGEPETYSFPVKNESVPVVSEPDSAAGEVPTVPSDDNRQVIAQPAESQPAPQPAPQAEETDVYSSPEREAEPLDEETRKRLHENYMRLISEPVGERRETEETPYAENINTENLIYNNKPETERDYRNLINNLFMRTVQKQQPKPQPQPEPRTEPEQPVPSPVYADEPVTVRVEDEFSAKAESDGLKVNTSDYVVSGTRKRRYNRGGTMFKCSLIVGVIMLLEFALCLIFRKDLGINLAYPFAIFALACAQILIFGVMYYTEAGKSTRKPTSLTYLSACVIISVIIILIICLLSILIGTNFTSASEVMANIVIPSIVALNIPVFAVFFYLLSK